MNIPITKTHLGKEEERSVVNVLRSGWLAQGARVREFEEVVANYLGVPYAVATSSCTTSLHLALLTLGIGKGDEVIVPSYTFIATSNAVLYCGAKPVFADIDSRTFNIDPLSVEKKISKRTKAIIPVHQVGLPCDMDAILKLARNFKLKVVEDAACALGSEYRRRKIGSLKSEATCFSFHPRKAITTGEGGMILTNDRKLAQKARLLRSHGATVSAFDRHKSGRMSLESYPNLGYNYRMTDIQAALGIVQLKRLETIIVKRTALAEIYNKAFRNNPNIVTPYVPKCVKHVYQSYIVRIHPDCRFSRGEVMKMLQNKGIATRPGIMLIHTQPYYVKLFGRISLPVTEELSKQALILPLYPDLTKKEYEYIIDSLLQILSASI